MTDLTLVQFFGKTILGALSVLAFSRMAAVLLPDSIRTPKHPDDSFPSMSDLSRLSSGFYKLLVRVVVLP